MKECQASGLYGICTWAPLDEMAAVSSMRYGSTARAGVSIQVFVGASFPSLPFGTETLVGGFGNECTVDLFGKSLVFVIPEPLLVALNDRALVWFDAKADGAGRESVALRVGLVWRTKGLVMFVLVLV